MPDAEQPDAVEELASDRGAYRASFSPPGSSAEPREDVGGGVRYPPVRSGRLPGASPEGDVAPRDPAHRAAAQALPEVDEALVRRLSALTAADPTAWSAALPDPSVLSQYEQVLSGAADRILRSLESQTIDASKREDRIADAEIRIASRGQIWAVALALLCIVSAIVFFAVDKSVPGLVLLAAPVLLFLASLLRRSPGGAPE